MADLKKKRASRVVRELVDGASDAAIPEAERVYSTKSIPGWKQQIADAEATHSEMSFRGQPKGRAISEEEAKEAAKQLLIKRKSGGVREGVMRSTSPKSGVEQKITSSDLKPLKADKAPKLKADESIRKEAAQTLTERRQAAARRLAVRGGGEDRRKALIGAAKARSGVKLGVGLGLLGSAAGVAGRAIELKESLKAKRKPTLGEGMRMLLDLPQEKPKKEILKGQKPPRET